MQVSECFRARIEDNLGASGVAWLRDLPALIADLSQRWRIIVGEPFDLSYNYVARARRSDGAEAVLKVGPPWGGGEFGREIMALRLYDGDGGCQLLESDAERQAMLLERLRPGEMLLQVAADDDDTATRIGADVMRRLWRPASRIPDPGQFKPLAEWFDRAFTRHRSEYGGPGPFPAAILDRDEAIAAELLASASDQVLLHGDFHHYNVLSSERAGWLAIDPKGMLGDPGYEIGPFLINPELSTTVKGPALLRRRLDVLAEALSYDRNRLRDWAIAHAVLSACWSGEGQGTSWRAPIAAAEHLTDL
jgi:streptomycin 6-kinase